MNIHVACPAKGSGPGLVLLTSPTTTGVAMRARADLFAEEGYVVVATASSDIPAAIEALRARPELKGRIGLLSFGATAADLNRAYESFDVAVYYEPPALALRSTPVCKLVVHSTEAMTVPDGVELYRYADATPGFTDPASSAHHKSIAGMAHSRTIAALRSILGPIYDLSALWEQHLHHEFETRDVAATMRTMIDEPYVNHVPTMAGGVGYAHLARFYQYHFVHNNPADMHNIPISRTVGADRVVEEVVLGFTHDREIDWLLPGIAPTGRYVEIALVVVIQFRGDKLCNEHIYWDQASVLKQVGLLDGLNLPIAGAEASKKLMDVSRPSNTMIDRWKESEGKPIPPR